MLDLDPDTRISIDEAFKHPYIVSYHDPDDEPTSPPFDHSFEDKKLNAMGWRGETETVTFLSFMRAEVIMIR